MSNKYKRFIVNQNGIFLAELIVGMIVMVIIMGAIFGIMSATSKAYLYNSAQSSNIAGDRDILDTIDSEVRYADAITNPVFPSGKASRIDYTVGVQTRSIYTITGNPATTSSLVIAYNGVVQRTIAINNVQSITFQRDISNTQLLTVSIQLNNNASSNSPSLSSSFIVIMPNM
jgi:hypothetical protein